MSAKESRHTGSVDSRQATTLSDGAPRVINLCTDPLGDAVYIGRANRRAG